MKTIVREGKKIIGFVDEKPDGSFWFAFGKPSQREYIEFSCKSLDHGIINIKDFSLRNYKQL